MHVIITMPFSCLWSLPILSDTLFGKFSRCCTSWYLCPSSPNISCRAKRPLHQILAGPLLDIHSCIFCRTPNPVLVRRQGKFNKSEFSRSKCCRQQKLCTPTEAATERESLPLCYTTLVAPAPPFMVVQCPTISGGFV